MALHTDLPIHKTGCQLLALAINVQTQIPRTVKRQLGNKITEHCIEMLDLMAMANANSDVHSMVTRGEVSGSVAAKMVRQHGEGAGKVLAAAHADAKAKGKDKVMPKAVAKVSNAAAVAPIDAAARHADLFAQYQVSNYPDLTEKLTALVAHLQGKLRSLSTD